MGRKYVSKDSNYIDMNNTNKNSNLYASIHNNALVYNRSDFKFIIAH